MDRKKIFTGLAAFLSGAAMLASNAEAVLTGYLMGDPAPGKLVPYYQIDDNLATLIGIENVFGDGSDFGVDFGKDIKVHVTIFTTKSAHQVNFDLCLSPFDFGYVVLQKGPRTPGQLAELFGDIDEIGAVARFRKARVITQAEDLITDEGYVSLRAQSWFDTTDGSCGDSGNGTTPIGDFADADPEPIATWAILQDVGSGFFATEIPSPTAIVHPFSGDVSGGFGAYGLIPADNWVVARYDVNPLVDSETSIYVWLDSNSPPHPSPIIAYLECEDELEISTTISVPNEVNVIDPDLLAGIGQCKQLAQYRGVLLFSMPDTGFVWSQISQAGQHYRENFLGYNLQCNTFIDGDGITCNDTIGNGYNLD